MRGRRTVIPGVGRDAERILAERFTELDERLRRLERKTGRAGVVSESTAARAGEFLNIEARAGGEPPSVILPKATQALRNERVTLNFRNSNPVRIVAIESTVNGESFVTNTAVGTFDAVCDGLGGWSVETGLTSTGSAVDAEYVVGAAHASLPNARVATDSTEIDADVTTDGVISWVIRTASVVLGKLADLAGLSVVGRASNTSGAMAAITATSSRQALLSSSDGTSIGWRALEADDEASTWADVLARGAASGESDPHIDTGQFIGFGDASSLPTSGQIRSSANWTARVTGQASMVGSTSVSISSGTCGFTATAAAAVAAASNTHILLFPNNEMRFTTNNVLRFTIEIDGAWKLGASDTGDAREVIRSLGASDPPEWGYPISVRDNTGTATDAYQLDFLDGTYTTAVQAPSGSGNTFVQVDVNVPALLLAIDSTSIVVSSGTLQRAALSGAVAASQNSNATVFSGIRNNGSATTDRTNLNFINSTTTNAVLIDDSGADEIEVAFPVNTTADFTWTGTHRFDEFIHFGTTSSLPSAGDIRKAGDMLIATASDMTLQADLSSTGFIELIAGDVKLTASDDVQVTATGDMLVTADVLHLDSGTSGVNGGFLAIQESSGSTPSVAAGDGMFWVEDTAPTRPRFTDDTNVDHELVIKDERTEFTAAVVLEGEAHLLVTEQEVSGSGPHDVTLNSNVTRLTFTSSNVTVNSISGGDSIGRTVLVYFSGSGTHTMRHATAGGSGNSSRVFNHNNADLVLTGARSSFMIHGNGSAGWRSFAYVGD